MFKLWASTTNNRVIGHTGKISWKFYFKNYFQSSRLMLICNCQTTKRNTRNRRLSTIQKCCSFSEPKPSHNWEIVFEIKFPDIRFAGMPDYSTTATTATAMKMLTIPFPFPTATAMMVIILFSKIMDAVLCSTTTKGCSFIIVLFQLKSNCLIVTLMHFFF